jgi:two-component system sensor histidine kinase MtrB
LTAVVGFAQLLQGDGVELSAEDRKEMVRVIVEEGVDLTNIVDDLLVAAKAEAGTLTAAHVRVDLLAQASQVVETWGDLVGSRIRLSGDRVATISDPARVRQVLRNLVSNALRYGGEHIDVHVSRSGNMAAVTVSDDGVGVPPEDEETIFEPYRRAHDAPGVTASMGLGLTISRQLARLMGGDLVYRRADGVTVFELSLPLAI